MTDTTPLVQYPGRLRNGSDGWTFKPGDAAADATAADAHEHASGRLQCPALDLDKPVDGPGYYQLTFTGRAGESGYWWVDLWDADGKPLADMNSQLRPGDLADYREVVYVQSPAARAQLAFQTKGGCEVHNVIFRRIDVAAAAAWCDEQFAAVQAAVAPFPWQPTGDLGRLPRTAAALRDGTPWRVVMLGDSLMNDSYTSVFQALVERDFPSANIQFIISVRGSTGCWFYQEPENFADYVTRLRPNLLLVGGISNFNNRTAEEGQPPVIKVVEMAQAAGIECAILGPPYGRDWRNLDGVAPGAPVPPQEWHERNFGDASTQQGKQSFWVTPLREAAAATGAAFWDITQPTMSYVGASGKPFHFFNRDAVHNNDLGKQIIGRVLQRYFQHA